jgi:hypothetical protein
MDKSRSVLGPEGSASSIPITLKHTTAEKELRMVGFYARPPEEQRGLRFLETRISPLQTQVEPMQPDLIDVSAALVVPEKQLPFGEQHALFAGERSQGQL